LKPLRNGTIGGAALDVTDPEPPIKGGPIFDVPNLVLTPHSAAMSADFQRNFFEASIQVILDAMAGKLESHSINKHLMLNAESFIMHVTWFLSTKV
jgi:D-3-phosphoglycerate dehydrogenase